MHPPDASLNIHELANQWSVAVAALAGLAVFGFVARILLNTDLSMGLTLPRIRLRLPRRLRRRRRTRPVSVAAEVPSIAADPEWQSITGIIQTRADRLDAITALHARAADRVEAAEYTLDRLLCDCAAHLLEPEDAARMHRRRVALAESPVKVQAAASESLAA